jgi:hypothetical protein
LKHKLAMPYEPCFQVGMLILRHWAEVAVPMTSVTALRMGHASPVPPVVLQSLPSAATAPPMARNGAAVPVVDGAQRETVPRLF